MTEEDNRIKFDLVTDRASRRREINEMLDEAHSRVHLVDFARGDNAKRAARSADTCCSICVYIRLREQDTRTSLDFQREFVNLTSCMRVDGESKAVATSHWRPTVVLHKHVMSAASGARKSSRW